MKSFYFQEKEELNQFVRSRASSTGAEFLESWEWGEIVKQEGAEILRMGVREERKILAAATLVKKPLAPLGGYFYWFAPRGPIGTIKAVRFLIKEVKKIDRRALFLRSEPESEPEPVLDKVKRTKDIQPSQTLILDLGLSEETLLATMHPKTRYNIRLAEKKEVEVGAGSGEDFSELWRLMNLTGERDQFRLHGEKHYKNLLAAGEFIKLFFARYQGRNIAAGLFCFWGDKVTYLHGASDNEFRNVMAPSLLQWSVIKMAKAGGYKYYDFYGLDEKKWPGVTRFKLGFGGRRLKLPGTFDFIFRPVLYSLYSLLRKLGRLRKCLR